MDIDTMQVDGSSQLNIDLAQGLMTWGYGWLLGELQSEAEEGNKPFTREDSEKALKKVSRRVKK